MIYSNVIYFVPLAVYCLWVTKNKRKIHTIIFLFLLGIIPITLLGYTHIRYFARYYPLIIFIIILGLREVLERKKGARLFLLYLFPVGLFQIFQLRHVFMSGYWFPD